MVDIKNVKKIDEKIIGNYAVVRLYSFTYDNHYVVVNYRLSESDTGFRTLVSEVLTIDGEIITPKEYKSYDINDAVIINALIDYEYSVFRPICKLLGKTKLKFTVKKEEHPDRFSFVMLKDQYDNTHHFEIYGNVFGKNISLEEAIKSLRKYAYVVYCVEI